jgi:hypothetical protein
MTSKPLPPRFRIVLDVTFSEASPWDPSDYSSFLKQMQELLEASTRPKMVDVLLREACTISHDADDYDDWRNRTGACEIPSLPSEGIGRLGGAPCPFVRPEELKRVWDVSSRAIASRAPIKRSSVLAAQGLFPKESPTLVRGLTFEDIQKINEHEEASRALLIRFILLIVLEERNLLNKWQQGDSLKMTLFTRAATCPIEGPLRTFNFESFANEKLS